MNQKEVIALPEAELVFNWDWLPWNWGRTVERTTWDLTKLGLEVAIGGGLGYVAGKAATKSVAGGIAVAGLGVLIAVNVPNWLSGMAEGAKAQGLGLKTMYAEIQGQRYSVTNPDTKCPIVVGGTWGVTGHFQYQGVARDLLVYSYWRDTDQPGLPWGTADWNRDCSPSWAGIHVDASPDWKWYDFEVYGGVLKATTLGNGWVFDINTIVCFPAPAGYQPRPGYYSAYDDKNVLASDLTHEAYKLIAGSRAQGLGLTTMYSISP